MQNRENAERAAQQIALLDAYHRNRRELERREANYEVLKVPLELQSELADVRERIDEIEARLRSLELEDAAGEVARQVHRARLRQAREEITHLHTLQRKRRANVNRLEQREASYGPGQAPLHIISSLDVERKELDKLESRRRRTEAEMSELERRLAAPAAAPATTAAPEPLHLFITTPDGARYETQVEADLLVAQLRSAFLGDWQPPDDPGLVRYTLRPAPDARPLEPALSLAEAGVQDGATLHLVRESLSQESPVALTVEDAAGRRYVTAVRLDTPVETLAQAFMESQYTARGEQREGQMEQASLAGLVQQLVDHFDREELRSLCFRLGVEYDDLPAEGRAAKARELVRYLARRGRIPELLETGQRTRPDVDWAVPTGAWSAKVELLSGPAATRHYRALRGEATLYEERVGDGAQLRILPRA